MSAVQLSQRVALLCGGVGAAKLARGLSRRLGPGYLTTIVNVGDDFSHWGLHVSPDIDSVVYALADVHDRQRGWGRRDETWSILSATQALGGQAWFAIGDHDLATHLTRTDLLARGYTLSQATKKLCENFGVTTQVMPATDETSPTVLTTIEGETISFQEYFVKRRHSVEIAKICFPLAHAARATDQVIDAITNADQIVIAPSNPFLSINPVLAIAPIGDLLSARRPDVCAVSPLVGGRAIKGPADRLLSELGYASDTASVAEIYAPYVSTMIIDRADLGLVDKIEALNYKTIVDDILMRDDAGEDRVADLCLASRRLD